MANNTLRSLIPTLILIAGLGLLGLYLYLFTESKVLWWGFFAMTLFYTAIFYTGTYAGKSHQIKDETDMMLAGRALPLGIAVFTMSATWIDGGYINGTAESTAKNGLLWVQAPWGYAISLIIGGLFFARKMRRYRFRTMLDPLEQRFGKHTAALLFLPALSGEIFWTAAILTALGSTFGTVLNLDFTTAVIISAVIAITYTSLGGLWAVAFTDTLQFFLLIGGLIIVVPFALESVGGWEHAWGIYTKKMGGAASPLPDPKVLGDYFWNWWDYALLLMFGGIPWQVYFQRVLGSKNEKVAMRLSIAAGFICLFAAIPPAIIGIVGAVFPEIASWESVGANTPPDLMILPYVLRYLTPIAVATIGLGAVAAAVMSSVDASVLSASSMASWNVYRPLFNPNISSEGLKKVLQRFIWIVGITATLLALQVKSVYSLWVLCSDFVYCLLFPALTTALFDKKANTIGVLAGFLVAFVLRFGGGEPTLGLPVLLPYPMTVFDEKLQAEVVLFPFRTLAMVSGLLTILVVSRFTQKQSPPRPLIPVE